jgi:hypothetical protein
MKDFTVIKLKRMRWAGHSSMHREENNSTRGFGKEI